MYSYALLALSLLGSSALAYEANVTIYSTKNCGGDADLLYIDVSQTYCFPLNGSSFSHYSESSKEERIKKCEIITYTVDGCPENTSECSYYGEGLTRCEYNYDTPDYDECWGGEFFKSIRINCGEYSI